MVPYLVLYALIFFSPIFCRFFQYKTQRKYIYCLVVFGTVLLLIGLRHPTMGNDLPGYLKSFHRLHDLSWKTVISLKSYLNYEKGYVLFCKLMSGLLFESEQLYLFVCAAISTIPIGYTVFKKSQDVVLSTIVYLGLPVFLIQYSGLRQAIALGICFYTINLIEEKKFWHFLGWILLASWFHGSAFVFILAYFLYHLKISEGMRWLLLVLLPIVYILRLPLFNLFIRIFQSSSDITETNAITLLLVFVLIYIFILITYHRDHGNVRANGYINIYFFACICQIFSSIHTTAMRVGYYFMIILILLLPMAVSKIRYKEMAWFVRCIIIFCFVAFAFDSIMGSSWAGAYPYYGFWQTIRL